MLWPSLWNCYYLEGQSKDILFFYKAVCYQPLWQAFTFSTDGFMFVCFFLIYTWTWYLAALCGSLLSVVKWQTFRCFTCLVLAYILGSSTLSLSLYIYNFFLSPHLSNVYFSSPPLSFVPHHLLSFRVTTVFVAVHLRWGSWWWSTPSTAMCLTPLSSESTSTGFTRWGRRWYKSLLCPSVCEEDTG